MAQAVAVPAIPYLLVVLSAGLITSAALTYTVRTAAAIASETTINAANFKARTAATALATLTAKDLDIARSVPVIPTASRVPPAAVVPAPATASPLDGAASLQTIAEVATAE